MMGREVLGSLSTTIAGYRIDLILTAAILTSNAGTVPWTDAWSNVPSFYATANARYGSIGEREVWSETFVSS